MLDHRCRSQSQRQIAAPLRPVILLVMEEIAFIHEPVAFDELARGKAIGTRDIVERALIGLRGFGMAATGAQRSAHPGPARDAPALALDHAGRIDIERAPAAQRVGRSEEHTSALQSLMRKSYAALCLKKKKKLVRN